MIRVLSLLALMACAAPAAPADHAPRIVPREALTQPVGHDALSMMEAKAALVDADIAWLAKFWWSWFSDAGGRTHGPVMLTMTPTGEMLPGRDVCFLAWTTPLTGSCVLLLSPIAANQPVNGGVLIPGAGPALVAKLQNGVALWTLPFTAKPKVPFYAQAALRIGKVTYLSNAIAVHPEKEL